jgi:hypothetical protein
MEIAYYLPSLTPKVGLTTATVMAAKKEVVYTKFFHRPNRSISLRSFCIARDMPVIQQWAWNISQAADIVAASYLYTGASDFARSFMVLVNNRIPLCQIDISHATKDELYESYRSAPGDFIIRFLLNTNKKKIRPLHIKALQTCIEYFFSFTEVKQLVAAPDAGNKLHNELLQKAGFRFREKMYSHYSVSNLYICPRDHFHNALFQ